MSIFLAGDAVQLMRDSVLDDLVGLGTGKLREHYDVIVANNVDLYLSGMSCVARGVTDQDLENKPLKRAMPDALTQLTVNVDNALTY